MPFNRFSGPDKWSMTTAFTTIILSYVTYLIGVAIHRLYFSQYAKFPGPKLAALTYGYMFYYDAIVGEGQYMYKIKDLHDEYGELLIQQLHCRVLTRMLQTAQSSESALTNST